MMKPTKQNFSLGQLSLGKYVNCDWGDVCDEDWKQNDDSIRDGERILASYHHIESQTKIWIITERDRSVTTILFPEEY